MQKTIEERLADIDSSLTRLTKMQGCVFGVLLVLDNISTLGKRTEWSTRSLEESVESISRNVDYSLRFIFGTLATLGITISTSALYSTTKDFLLAVLSILSLALTGVLFFFAVRYDRRASSQRKTFHSELLQTREQSQSLKEQAVALNDTLAQIIATWRELVPHDLASEPRSDTPGSKDSAKEANLP